MGFNKAEERVEQAKHWSFNVSGGISYSETVFDSPLTSWAKKTASRVRKDQLTPADVVLEVSRLPEHIQRAFSLALLGDWSARVRFDDWPTVQSDRPIMRFIQCGGGEAWWATDPNAWAQACDSWERRNREVSRFTVARSRVSDLGDVLGGAWGVLADSELAKLEGSRHDGNMF